MEAIAQYDVEEHDEQATSKLALSACQICQESSSKYRCPRCALTTCSLPCSVTHKIRDKCSGKRDRAKFVSRSTFDEFTLHSDICLLDDAARITENAQKLMKSVDPMKHKQVLVDEANRRRVDLRLLAEWFPKRKENRTYYGGNKMFWTVRWIVQSSESTDAFGDYKLMDILKHRCMEHIRLFDLIKSLPSTTPLDEKTKELLTSRFRNVNADSLEVKLRLDPAYSLPSRREISLSSKRKLKDCLAGHIIVEYPTMVVTVKPKAETSLCESNTERAAENPVLIATSVSSVLSDILFSIEANDTEVKKVDQ
ncbi:hypothetical protein RvY_04289 [Ramazzottius varieornatus]|uniref:Box C/D snoRNA protein 1 n=1 Tax=Ramazzottius varieornatus TaxID=947166 RepID=A0A1D1UR51_RAMVA|nr:hypothetical protein RvY_04289 [Ramazzottius varieornatus]